MKLKGTGHCESLGILVSLKLSARLPLKIGLFAPKRKPDLVSLCHHEIQEVLLLYSFRECSMTSELVLGRE